MNFFRILRAMLREIFEEAAYERFCSRERFAVNQESYAKFLRESEQARLHKARCC
jgi:hypothetical protein